MVGNWVKILKESQTKGLVGAVLKVVALKPDNVVVSALDTEVLFKYDEVKVLTFKERWGFDRMPRLYHGTDLRFVKIHEDVRQKYLAFCKSLINDFIKIYEPYITNKESISELKGKFYTWESQILLIITSCSRYWKDCNVRYVNY